ncbi:hypothetical protein A4S05_30550 [Nostoc sp. KVJ20]|nr:hypothetical protein A4S05_30550 [Nostoc sp. KVJ20]
MTNVTNDSKSPVLKPGDELNRKKQSGVLNRHILLQRSKLRVDAASLREAATLCENAFSKPAGYFGFYLRKSCMSTYLRQEDTQNSVLLKIILLKNIEFATLYQF